MWSQNTSPSSFEHGPSNEWREEWGKLSDVKGCQAAHVTYKQPEGWDIDLSLSSLYWGPNLITIWDIGGAG